MTEPQEPRDAAPAHPTSEELSECAFSPEAAAAGLLGHVQGCTRCAGEVADLRLLLTELAALPEPEVPESVAIRMDAAVARAWQEADAEQQAATEARGAGAGTAARRGRRLSWAKIAIPLGSLSLIVLAVIGIADLAHHNQSGTSASSSSGVSANASAQVNGATTSPALASWVHSILSSTAGTAHTEESPMGLGVHCANTSVPQRSGYKVLTTSQREFDNRPATLVVYQNAQEPASPTVYAVVYAGSCPSPSSAVLAEGYVSR